MRKPIVAVSIECMHYIKTAIDRRSNGAHSFLVKTIRRPSVAAVLFGLAYNPVLTCRANVPNFTPDPAGEKLYREQLHHELLPLVILVVAFTAACLVRRIVRKTRRTH